MLLTLCLPVLSLYCNCAVLHATPVADWHLQPRVILGWVLRQWQSEWYRAFAATHLINMPPFHMLPSVLQITGVVFAYTSICAAGSLNVCKSLAIRRVDVLQPTAGSAKGYWVMQRGFPMQVLINLDLKSTQAVPEPWQVGMFCS